MAPQMPRPSYVACYTQEFEINSATHYYLIIAKYLSFETNGVRLKSGKPADTGHALRAKSFQQPPSFFTSAIPCILFYRD
jgi:hypothetical protein